MSILWTQIVEIGPTRENLYNCKRQLLKEGRVYSMTNKKSSKTLNTHKS